MTMRCLFVRRVVPSVGLMAGSSGSSGRFHRGSHGQVHGSGSVSPPRALNLSCWASLSVRCFPRTLDTPPLSRLLVLNPDPEPWNPYQIPKTVEP